MSCKGPTRIIKFKSWLHIEPPWECCQNSSWTLTAQFHDHCHGEPVPPFPDIQAETPLMQVHIFKYSNIQIFISIVKRLQYKSIPSPFLTKLDRKAADIYLTYSMFMDCIKHCTYVTIYSWIPWMERRVSGSLIPKLCCKYKSST